MSRFLLLLSCALRVAAWAGPIIGGSGDFKYQYMPELLQAPAGAVITNAHGLVIDGGNNIILTYQNDGKTDKNCLIKWKPDGTGGEFLTGGGSALCDGTPHGLQIADEGPMQVLYHANNNQKLTKTTMDGTILWQHTGNFGQDPTVPYRPTWFAVPPKSTYVYLCDGYGSNNVYVFDRANGTFMNVTYGGKGGLGQHGKFSTNHGCTYDARSGLIAVSDRANHRIEYFSFDDASPHVFKYESTVDMRPGMGATTLPCNLRSYPEQEGRAISPDLNGPVAVLDSAHAVVSVVNVSVLLAALEHKHPHDAIFLPNGDMVVATWAPGRISYWKKL
jgi:DNA-binding beta-propeller fold protein YncE